MRMAFGLVSILVTIGVIAWIWHEVEGPDIKASLDAQKQVDPEIKQWSGLDADGRHVEETFKVFADLRDDNKLQDLQVTQVSPGSTLDVKYGLKPNDVITAVVDASTLRTDMNGLDNEQAGMDAIRDAYAGGGQIVVVRGDHTLTLPLPKAAPSQTPPAAALTPQQQQTAQKTEQQQEGKSNDGSENGTMDQLHQQLHSLPGY